MRIKLRAIIVAYRREISATSAGLAVLIMLNLLIPWNTHAIVTAARDIPMGSVLKSQDLTTVHIRYTWPTSFDDPGELIGKESARAIRQGEPLLRSSTVGQSLLDGLPIGQVAVTVPISTIDVGLLHVGDVVSLMSANNAHEGILISARARILAMTNSKNSSFFDKSASMTVVVAVSTADARAIAGVRDNQTLTVVLQQNR